MKKLIAIFLLCSFFNIANAQLADSSYRNHLKPDIYDKSWCVSVNAGIQKRLYLGAGIAYSSFNGSEHGAYGSDVYGGVNVFPAFKKNYETVTGIKFGGDLFGNTVLIGTEIQYLTSKGAEDWLFTPRAGIGISYVYLAYGYSLSKNKFPIAGISRNSLTLQLHFPFYTKDKLTNKITRWNGMRTKK